MMSVSSTQAAAPARSPSVHWPEALMEGLGLGLFMISAGIFGTLLEYPGSPLRHAVPAAGVRRALMGLAMGLTAVGLVRSPWGRRSGAHINPAVTWTFFRLGRVDARDALAYTALQFAGGLAGALAVAAVLGPAFLAPPVGAVATLPGASGLAVAFGCETLISGVLIFVVLVAGASARLARHTPWLVAGLLFLYITFEAPLSGMSMNPARSLASAVPSGSWRGLWIYFSAPLVGMWLGAELFVATRPPERAAGCAKLLHRFPCIFCGEEDRNAVRSRT
jgi:aquaporin Z